MYTHTLKIFSELIWVRCIFYTQIVVVRAIRLSFYISEILQSRLVSRDQLSSLVQNQKSTSSHLYTNVEENKKVKDVTDVLGPLPNIPANDP